MDNQSFGLWTSPITKNPSHELSVAKAEKHGATVHDVDCNGFVNVGDTIAIPTFHRNSSYQRRPFVFSVTEQNERELSLIFSSPPGFRVRRHFRDRGDTKQWMHYSYQFTRGQLEFDQVQTLTMIGSACRVFENDVNNVQDRPCTPFEKSLFRTNADDEVPFITERLIVERHMAAVEELERLQQEIRWTNDTEGRDLDLEPTYRGYEFLFSDDVIPTIDALIQHVEQSGDSDETAGLGVKELQFYRQYLIAMWLERGVGAYEDRIKDVLNEDRIPISWLDRKVCAHELGQLLASEQSGDRRQELLKLRAQFQREVYNPLLLEREGFYTEAVQKFYPSYFDFVVSAKNVADPNGIIDSAKAFSERTDSIYQQLLAHRAKGIGKTVEELRWSDLGVLFDPLSSRKFFPAELMVPFMRYTFEGMGFTFDEDLNQAILINDFPHPRKDPNPKTYPVSVPDDVRFTIMPHGGMSDFNAMLHEMTHALHYTNVSTQQWALKYLGDRMALETYAVMIGHLMCDPDFLMHYRDFVHAWNSQGAVEKKVPELADKDIAEIVRAGALRKLYMVRRYNVGKMQYERAVMRGDGYRLNDSPTEPSIGRRTYYGHVFEGVYGFPLEEEDLDRYVSDVSPDFVTVDYARAFTLAPHFSELLSRDVGSDWYVNPDTADFLRTWCFQWGTSDTEAEYADRFGMSVTDNSALFREIQSNLRRADELAGPLPSDGTDGGFFDFLFK